MVLLNEPKILGPISINQAYQICEDITKSASTSFLRSFKSLPLEKRSSVHALYAFCRKVDDIVDGDLIKSGMQEEPPTEEPIIPTPEEEENNILKKVDLGRAGNPKDISSAVYFLTEAKYITGQTLRVDGGRS